MKLNRRELMKRGSAVAATGILGPVGVRAVQGQAGVKQIEYWHRQTGNAAAAIESAAAAFNEAYAGQIEVLPVAQGDIATLTQKVRTAAAGGGLPAALMADDADILSYYQSELIVPLEAYLQDSGDGLSAEERADFLPNQLTRHALPLYDNHTMTFPIGFSTYTLFWNEDALAKTDLAAPPHTWDEFPTAVRAIADGNPGMVFNTQPDLGPILIFSLMSQGVSWLKPNGTESNFDAPEVVSTMTWMSELASEGLLVPNESHVDLFKAGRSMFVLQSSVNARAFNDEITDFAWNAGLPPQAATTETPVTELFGPMNVLPATDEETQRAGWLWLKWLTEPAQHAAYNAAAGYFPARKSAAAEPVMQDYYETNPVHGQLFGSVAPYARIPDQGPGLVGIRGAIASNVLAELTLGRLSPEDAALKLKAEADAEITRSV